jgi:hypothetical protein
VIRILHVPKQQSTRAAGQPVAESSKSARTRQRILDAAATVLNRNGYAGARLSDIAELAQVQAPALWWNPSKHSLRTVISTAQLLARQGLAAPPPASIRWPG